MRGRKRGREKHQLVASCTPPTGDQAHTPGMCPDQESNQRPFDSQPSTQPTEPHQPGPEFFVENLQITQVIQPPLQPRHGTLWLLVLPQTKITFEREEISDQAWDSGKYDGAADDDWENSVRSLGAYFEGDWGTIVLCTMFLVSSSINVSIFHITWLDNFWTGYIYIYIRMCVCVYIVISQHVLLWKCTMISIAQAYKWYTKMQEPIHANILQLK